jgi:hypothetical protein
MSNGTDQPIQQLLDERLKVMQWLDRLSAAGQEAPPDVLERVQRDYQNRLDGVARQLEGYQEELEHSRNQFESERKELAENERDARDKLAEAELRHIVGEFEDGRWTGLRAEIANELGSVRNKLQETETEIQRLDEVLGLIRDKPNTQVRKAIPLREPPPPIPAQFAPEPEPLPEPEMIEPSAPPIEPPSGTKAMDELAFLKSVTEDEQQGPAASQASGRGSAPEPIMPERISHPEIRRERESGPKKTLKCGECGVMNFPTEWYCERCGAELAAL